MRKKDEPIDLSLISQKQSVVPGCGSQHVFGFCPDEKTIGFYVSTRPLED